MPFYRPTLKRIIRRVSNDLETRVSGLITKVKRSFEYGITRVLAGLSHSLHGHLEWNGRQLFVDTADSENVLRWGEIFKVPRKEPTVATGKIQVSGTVGQPVPINTVWEYLGAEGEPPRYTNPVAAVIGVNGFIIIDVEAVEAGAAGNVEPDEELTLLAPLPGVNSVATVVEYEPITGGNDIEAIDPDYRNRVLFAARNPPKGGGPGDWVGWALAVAGVTRAWELGNVPEPGKVTVLIVNDATNPPSPSAQLITDVKAYIDDRAPITAIAVVEGPELVPLDPVIKLDTDTSAIRLAVTKELDDLITNNDYRDGTLKVSLINDAISNAPGWAGHDLVSPAADVVYGSKQIPVVGTITWA